MDIAVEPQDETLRGLLVDLADLDQILVARKRQNGLKYFRPNAMQLRAFSSMARTILFCGGNRSGKTTAGAAQLAMHLTKEYPDYYPKEKRFVGPMKAVVVASENAIIDRVLEPRINQYLPKSYRDKSHYKRVTGGYLSRIIGADGSTVDFLSNEQDDMAFESQDWDWYWGDEPQKKRKFDAIMRGLLDRGGRTFLTFTPLIEPWMKEQLVDRSDGKTIESFVVDTRDNKFDIEGTPILLEENIAAQEAMWDEDTIETRIHGKFFHLRGAVYPMFSEAHQLDFEYEYPKPVVCVLDPHDRQPHHVIWAMVDEEDSLYVHSELDRACTVDELAKAILAHEKSIYSEMAAPTGGTKSIKMGFKVRRRLIDPNFGRKPLITTGRNMIQELAKAGCGGWIEADDPKDEGRLKVKEYLHYNVKKELSLTNRPKLYFHKMNCKNTIRSMRNHQYEEWTGKTAGEKDPKEKTKDKETHGADCVRYLCMSNPSFERLHQGAQTYELENSPY